MVAEDRTANEIVAAAQDAKARRSAVGANPEPPARADAGKRWPIAAVGIGVGSAALAGALLYASRTRKR